jgi:hypothetical protein
MSLAATFQDAHAFHGLSCEEINKFFAAVEWLSDVSGAGIQMTHAGVLHRDVRTLGFWAKVSHSYVTSYFGETYGTDYSGSPPSALNPAPEQADKPVQYDFVAETLTDAGVFTVAESAISGTILTDDERPGGAYYYDGYYLNPITAFEPSNKINVDGRSGIPLSTPRIVWMIQSGAECYAFQAYMGQTLIMVYRDGSVPSTFHTQYQRFNESLTFIVNGLKLYDPLTMEIGLQSSGTICGMSTGTQSFSGDKTFNDWVDCEATVYVGPFTTDHYPTQGIRFANGTANPIGMGAYDNYKVYIRLLDNSPNNPINSVSLKSGKFSVDNGGGSKTQITPTGFVSHGNAGVTATKCVAYGIQVDGGIIIGGSGGPLSSYDGGTW